MRLELIALITASLWARLSVMSSEVECPGQFYWNTLHSLFLIITLLLQRGKLWPGCESLVYSFRTNLQYCLRNSVASRTCVSCHCELKAMSIILQKSHVGLMAKPQVCIAPGAGNHDSDRIYYLPHIKCYSINH